MELAIAGDPVTEVLCKHCFDTGVTFVTLFDGGIEMLMICDCDLGAQETYMLPRWERKVGMIASRMEFPTAWFKPPEGMRGVFGQKMEQWKAKIQVAEEYWHHQRVVAMKPDGV